MVISIWNEPSLEELARIPPLYSTEKIPVKDHIIYEHFFIFSSDWYISEYDQKSKIMFGYAILNDDYQNSEWGYVDYNELKELNVHGFEVDRDLDWYPKKASLVDRIVKGGGV